ncbi:MAG TPA: hypothetical protein DE179_08570 [Oceanospirillaceae bacterium]|nr:hypothetical protein [Oceanospirillaceae bacterium]
MYEVIMVFEEFQWLDSQIKLLEDKASNATGHKLVHLNKMTELVRGVHKEMHTNFDKDDNKYLKIVGVLKNLSAKDSLNQTAAVSIVSYIETMQKVQVYVKELNRKNTQLNAWYQEDARYTRVHKRIKEQKIVNSHSKKIYLALSGIKNDLEHMVLINDLENVSDMTEALNPLVITRFMNQQQIIITVQTTLQIAKLIAREYMPESSASALPMA